jgi:hypothetical protein
MKNIIHFLFPYFSFFHFSFFFPFLSFFISLSFFLCFLFLLFPLYLLPNNNPQRATAGEAAKAGRRGARRLQARQRGVEHFTKAASGDNDIGRAASSPSPRRHRETMAQAARCRALHQGGAIVWGEQGSVVVQGSPNAAAGGGHCARKFHPPRTNQYEPPSRMTFVHLISHTPVASAMKVV